jgi:IS5 family transposase
LKVTRATLGYVESVGECLKQARVWGPAYEVWLSQVKHYCALIEGVIDQAECRVLCRETMRSADKVVSLFEEHTDIIVMGSRDVQYGHKLNLVSGRSALILDVVIERGNPADSQRYLPMLERHCESHGVMAR